MDDMEQVLDITIEQLKQLGVSRNDGEELTREDAAKLLGVMAVVFTDMGNVMQESFARLQAIFGQFAVRASSLGMTMNQTSSEVVQDQMSKFQVKDSQ